MIVRIERGAVLRLARFEVERVADDGAQLGQVLERAAADGL